MIAIEATSRRASLERKKMNGTESPEITEEEIEEVAERSVNLIGKKILKWAAILAGFAVTGIALAKVLEPNDDIYVIEETGEVID